MHKQKQSKGERKEKGRLVSCFVFVSSSEGTNHNLNAAAVKQFIQHIQDNNVHAVKGKKRKTDMVESKLECLERMMKKHETFESPQRSLQSTSQRVSMRVWKFTAELRDI
jgi:hypothetical protein